MLSPDARLSEKIFDADIEQRPTRDGYGEGLIIAGEENKNAVALRAV